MKKMVTAGRQGDVLLISEKHKHLRPETKARLFGQEIPNKVDKKTNNRLAAAYGEASNHTHAVYKTEGVDLYYSSDIAETLKMFVVDNGIEAPIEHEEHEAILLTDGKTAVIGQMEWRDKIVRAAD